MGLSVAISGGIIMFGIVYLMFSLGGITDKILSVSDSSVQRTNLENKLVKTQISINSISNTPLSTNVSFVIENKNIEKLWEFEKFNVFLTYTDLISGLVKTDELTYVNTCPATSGKWCPSSFGNDSIEPKILNYGETLTINAVANNALQGGTSLTVIISTQNGVVATKTIVTA